MSSVIRSGLARLLAVTIALSGVVVWAAGSAGTAAQGGATTDAAGGTAKKALTGAAARGKYLVDAGGCHDCHTPAKMGPNGPEPDMTLMLSGHPAAMQLPPPPAPQGPWIGGVAATFTAWYGPWGRAAVHRHDPHRAPSGPRPPDSAAHALAGVQEPERRRSQGDLRLPPDDSGDSEQGARSCNRAAADQVAPALERVRSSVQPCTGQAAGCRPQSRVFRRYSGLLAAPPAGESHRGGHMTGNPEVIKRLNQGLRDELTAINQYFVHSEMCHNWGYHRLGGHIRKQSIDEMRHAEAFIERILFLDGTPTMEPMPLNIGQSVREQLERDLGLEHGAVRTYNESIRICRDAGDNTSRELFERLLKTRRATSTGSSRSCT